MVLAGLQREGGGDGDHPRPAHGEDPVELREAQVVADAHPEGHPLERAAELGGDDLLAGLLVLGLAVGDPADVDVEHVDLAVAGLELAVGPDQDRGVERLLGPRRCARRCCRRPGGCPARGPRSAPPRSSGRRAARLPRAGPSESPSRFHFSGRTTSSAPSAAAARTRRSAVSRLRALSPVELSCMAAARIWWDGLTDQSIQASIDSPRVGHAGTGSVGLSPTGARRGARGRPGPPRSSPGAPPIRPASRRRSSGDGDQQRNPTSRRAASAITPQSGTPRFPARVAFRIPRPQREPSMRERHARARAASSAAANSTIQPLTPSELQVREGPITAASISAPAATNIPREADDGGHPKRARAHVAPLSRPPCGARAWRSSSATSSFVCSAAIRSLSGPDAGLDHLHRPVGVDVAGEPLGEHLDLLGDELLERPLVAQRVVDREADPLVVAAGAEAADRLDDRARPTASSRAGPGSAPRARRAGRGPPRGPRSGFGPPAPGSARARRPGRARGSGPRARSSPAAARARRPRARAGRGSPAAA